MLHQFTTLWDTVFVAGRYPERVGRELELQWKRAYRLRCYSTVVDYLDKLFGRRGWCFPQELAVPVPICAVSFASFAKV